MYDMAVMHIEEQDKKGQSEVRTTYFC